MQATNFFDYTTKRGYCIIIKDQARRLSWDQEMEAKGYPPAQRKAYFACLWLPRKISGMLWLTIAPIGTWRRRIGHNGICNLCTGNHLENSKHALFLCPAVSLAWERMRAIRVPAGLPPVSYTGNRHVTGILSAQTHLGVDSQNLTPFGTHVKPSVPLLNAHLGISSEARFFI